MSRARIRYNCSKLYDIIDNIEDRELHKIANLYYKERLSQLDIGFELDLSEKTINRRIKEIKKIVDILPK